MKMHPIIKALIYADSTLVIAPVLIHNGLYQVLPAIWIATASVFIASIPISFLKNLIQQKG